MGDRSKEAAKRQIAKLLLSNVPPDAEKRIAKILDEIGVGSEDLDEAVHDASTRLASNVNNQGLEAQIEYLGTSGVTDLYGLLINIIEDAET